MPNLINSLKSSAKRLFGKQPRVIPKNLAKCLNQALVSEIEALPQDSPKRCPIIARCIHFEQLLLQGKLDIAKCEAELRKMLKSNIGEQNNDVSHNSQSTTISKVVPQQDLLHTYDGGMGMLQNSLMDFNLERPQLSQFEMPKLDYHKTVTAQANASHSGRGVAGCKAVVDVVESKQKTSRLAISEEGLTCRTFIEKQAEKEIAAFKSGDFRVEKKAEVCEHGMDTMLKDRQDARKTELVDRQNERHYQLTDRENERKLKLEMDPGHQKFQLDMKELDNIHQANMDRNKLERDYRMKALEGEQEFRMKALEKCGGNLALEFSEGGKLSLVPQKALEGKKRMKNADAPGPSHTPMVEEPESEDGEDEDKEQEQQKETKQG